MTDTPKVGYMRLTNDTNSTYHRVLERWDGERWVRMSDVYQDIRDERAHQDTKFGPVRTMPLTEWVCVLTEEVGEAAEAVHELEQGRPDNVTSWWGALRDELVQVAATAVNMIEHMDRGDLRGSAEVEAVCGKAWERWAASGYPPISWYLAEVANTGGDNVTIGQAVEYHQQRRRQQ